MVAQNYDPVCPAEHWSQDIVLPSLVQPFLARGLDIHVVMGHERAFAQLRAQCRQFGHEGLGHMGVKDGPAR
jgi:hypothetical protein